MIRINNDEIEVGKAYKGISVVRDINYNIPAYRGQKGYESLIFKDLRAFSINKDYIHITAWDRWVIIKRTISLFGIYEVYVWDYEDKQICIYSNYEQHPENLTVLHEVNCSKCKYRSRTICRVENHIMRVYKAEPCCYCKDHSCFEKGRDKE